MNIDELDNVLNSVKEIRSITNEEWQLSLNERKKSELEFHDKDRDSSFVEQAKSNDTFEQFYGNKKYYKVIKRSQTYQSNWIANESKGKIFLDYACGYGGYAVQACKSGASLSLGFDLSKVSIDSAILNAHDQGLLIDEKNGISFFQADAEDTRLPDASIDRILCSGMLHHVDLSYALPEMRRILKPGGKILAVEALDYNPAIKLYRMLTPDMRTEWEKAHILSLKDLKFASRFFEIENIKFWHVLGYISGKIPFLFPFLDKLDLILEKIPYIQRMAWIFTFELVKKTED